MPFAQDHGFSTTLGLRIGAFAYSTDVTELDEAAFAAIEGVELWIVDCLRREPHPTHSHLAKTLSWIARVRPRRAVLTHMDQSLDYRELERRIAAGVEPGRDGLVIELARPMSDNFTGGVVRGRLRLLRPDKWANLLGPLLISAKAAYVEHTQIDR